MILKDKKKTDLVRFLWKVYLLRVFISYLILSCIYWLLEYVHFETFDNYIVE